MATEYTGEVVPVGGAQEYTGEVIPDTPKAKTLLRSLDPTNLAHGLYGLAEGGTQMITGMGSSAIGGLRGLNALVSGKGMDEATRRIEETQQKYTYQPRTAEGAATGEVLALPFEAAGKAGGYVGKVLGQSLSGEAPTSEKSQRWGDTGELIGKVGAEGGMTIIGGKQALKAAPKIQEAVTDPLAKSKAAYSGVPAQQSRAQGLKLDAIQKADQLGYTIPAKESAGKATLMERVGGLEEIDHAARVANQSVTNRAALNNVLKDTEAAQITPEVVAAAETRAMQPRREIEQLGDIPLAGDSTFTGKIANLDELAGLSPEVKALMSKGSEAAAKIDRMRDITSGMDSISGAEAMRVISDLRQQSSDVLFSRDVRQSDRAIAKAQRRLADALEERIERHLASIGNTDLLARFRQGRTEYAQIQDLKAATNRNTGNVDATVLADALADGDILTGPLKDMADVAAHAPNVMKSVDAAAAVPHTSFHGRGNIAERSMAGHAFGGAGVAAVVGGRLLTSSLAQKKALTPEYIRKHRLQDNRPLRERMGVQEHVNPPELALEPQSPHPPSPMGGTIVGRGPNEGGVVNLAPQLNAGMPSPGTGPGPLWRSTRRDPTVTETQIPGIEYNLPPKPGNTPLYERGGVPTPPREAFTVEQPYPGVGVPYEAPVVPATPPAPYSPGPAAAMAQIRALQRDPTPQKPQMPAVEMPLTPDMAKSYLSAIMEAMQRGDMETVATLEKQFNAAQQALQSQQPHAAHNLLYEPFRRR